MRPKFCILAISETCENRAHELTLNPTNSISNKFSGAPGGYQKHQHISKNKLTGGYRKRLSGSRAVITNVEFFPGFLFVKLTASTPPGLEECCLTERQNHLDKPIHRFREFQGRRGRAPKNDACHEAGQSPRDPYYSRDYRSTKHV